MRNINFSKLLSTTLSLAIATSSVPMHVGAAGPTFATPAFAERLAPTQKFGYVASSFASSGEEKPRLVVIADLHAHLEVQRNLMGILDKLVPTIRGTSTQKVPVFLEGGWTSDLEEPLRGLKHPNTRRFMNEYYLHKSELGGPQAYSEKVAGSNQMVMIGVEDKEEYLANKAIYAKSYPARKQVLEAIKFQEAAIGLLQDNITGRSYRKLQSVRKKYNDGQVTPERFAKVLLRYANRFHLEGKYVAVLRNLGAANPSEIEVAFSHVYREVSDRLADKRPWTAFLRQKLQNEDGVRANLAKVNGDLDLLKRVVANQLTPAEVTLAMSRIVDLQHTADLLLEDQPLSVDASRVVLQSLEFYPFAFLRDETLVKNSLKSLESFGSDTTGILVAGGFHTDAIGSYLKERKIPFMIIHPNVTREMTTEEQLNYVKRMGNEHVTISELRTDLAWLKSGQRTARAIGFTGTITGVKDAIMLPGQAPIKEQLMNGGNPEIQAGLETMSGEAYDQAVRDMENIGLDITNTNAREFTFVANEAGKYQSVDEIEGADLIARVLDDEELEVPGRKILLSAIPDKEAHLKYGGEAAHENLPGENMRIIISESRVSQIEAALREKPKAGSKAEANAIRAIVTLKHEKRHGSGLEEHPTVFAGLVDAGKSIATNLGEDSVGRIADAVKPQLEAGKATRGVTAAALVDKISDVFTPKALQSESVTKLARELSEGIPGVSPEQVQLQLDLLESTVVGKAAVASANIYSEPLRRRLSERFRSMAATAVAA